MAASSSQGGNNNDLRIVESDSSKRFLRYDEIIGESTIFLDSCGRYVRHNKAIEEGALILDSSGKRVRYNGGGTTERVYKGFDNVVGIEITWSKTELTENLLQNKEILEMLCAEGGLMKLLDHKNVVKCHDSWVDEEAKTIHMITEYFPSGNLVQYVLSHKLDGRNAIKNWCKQILNVINYLHSLSPQMAHRDINCDNIFINGKTGCVKVGDFGFAVILEQGTSDQKCVAPRYMAPLFIKETGYTELVDTFSFGMCVQEMVWASKCSNNKSEFLDSLVPTTLNAMADDNEALQFSRRCLTASSDGRPSANELLNDLFLAPTFLSTIRAKILRLLHRPRNGSMVTYDDFKKTPAYPESARQMPHCTV